MNEEMSEFESKVFEHYAKVASTEAADKASKNLGYARIPVNWLLNRVLKTDLELTPNISTDDPRLLRNGYVATSTNDSNINSATHHYAKSVPNYSCLTEQLANFFDKNNLSSHDKKVIISPHLKGMCDLALIGSLAVSAKVARPSTNHFLLGKLISHLSIRGKQIAFNQVRDLGNITQIIPHTQSTERLFESYPSECSAYNFQAMKYFFEGAKQDDATLFITPNGRRTQKTKKGLVIPEIPQAIIGLLQRFSAKDMPIIACTLDSGDITTGLASAALPGRLARLVGKSVKLDIKLLDKVDEQTLADTFIESGSVVTGQKVSYIND